MRSFMQRLYRAADNLERGTYHGRELDEALENGDGDAMMAALWTLADSRPKLRYVMALEWLDGPSPDVAALIGLPLSALINEAAIQRNESQLERQAAYCGQACLF